MRRKLVAIAVLLVLFVGFMFLRARPELSRGNFPEKLTETDRQEILSAARHDAMRQTFRALKHADFRQAWRWTVNGRKQTVRSVGNQEDGQIWVTFGFDEPGATDGYAIWARYLMTKQHGHWVMRQLY